MSRKDRCIIPDLTPWLAWLGLGPVARARVAQASLISGWNPEYLARFAGTPIRIR